MLTIVFAPATATHGGRLCASLLLLFTPESIAETYFRKLDAFHMRGLRYVFGLPPAYISRISNEEVIEMANDALQKDNIKNHPMDKITYEMLSRTLFKPEEFEHIKPISILVKQRQMSLLGHILRSDPENPERKVACDNSYMRLRAKYKRMYGPRDHWWDSTMELVFNTVKEDPQFEQILVETLGTKFNESYHEFQIDSAEQHFAIALWAEGRIPPFGTKKRPERRRCFNSNYESPKLFTTTEGT